MKAYRVSRVSFDDPNLVASAGLAPLMALAEAAGLSGALAGLTVDSPNPVLKARCVIAGMLAGADSIDDLDLLRAGGMPGLFGGLRAPSTLGTFLRAFTFGHVRQLDRAGAEVLDGLACVAPGLLGDAGAIAFVDVDDTIREVYGRRKQGAAFGYSGVRGLNTLIATISTMTDAPLVARTRVRRGNVRSGSASASMAVSAIGQARRMGAAGEVMTRADSAFYTSEFVNAVARAGAWFSVTARQDQAVARAIAAIPETAWQPIRYPQAVWDEQAGCWISDAEVAETGHVAFASTKNPVACRLVVRRVKALNPKGQDPLCDGWRHHAFVTNSTLTAVEADRLHRGHAIIEQVIEELKAGPLAHLPSGKYAANAAWAVLATIAFNLTRAAAHLAGLTGQRAATIRRAIINIPARIARSGRRLTLHLPSQWPWAHNWLALAGLPPPAGAVR